LRIIYLINSLGIGGAETLLCSMVLRLDRTKYEPIVVTIKPLKSLADELKQNNIALYSLGQTNKFGFFKAALRLWRLLKQLKPDVVHTHLYHSNVLGRLVAKAAGVPVVISTIHNTFFGGPFRQWSMRFTDRFCSQTTAICEASTTQMIKRRVVPKQKVRTIHNGIDVAGLCNERESAEQLKREFDIKPDQVVLLSVGRLQPQKGYAYAIQTAALLRDKGLDFRWFIAGHGELKRELEQLVNEQHLSDRMHFLGIRRDIFRLYSLSNVFVMSSLWEGLPIVLLESMALGLPVVVTEVGGNPEVVQQGINGFLVPPKDPVGLAERILQIVSMSEFDLDQMGDNNRQTIRERFSIDAVIRQTTSLYESLHSSNVVEHIP
jgi:glycosyltransferase involved in cell wall biosynthesis